MTCVTEQSRAEQSRAGSDFCYRAEQCSEEQSRAEQEVTCVTEQSRVALCRQYLCLARAARSHVEARPAVDRSQHF